MLASLLAVTLLAAAPAPPLEVVKAGNTELRKAASAPGATVGQLATVAERFIDFEELSRRALGKTWDTLTPAQRAEFSDTMRGLLRATYAHRLIGQGRAAVRYGKQTVKGEEATVSTTLTGKKIPVAVDYKLYRPAADKGAWRVYDVVTDGVSLLETQRGQFRTMMFEQGFNGLLGILQAKREQLEKASGTKVNAAGPAQGADGHGRHGPPGE